MREWVAQYFRSQNGGELAERSDARCERQRRMRREKEEAVIFAVNKNLEEDIEFCCDLRQFKDYRLVEHTELRHEDLNAVNTEEDPFNVAPVKNTSTVFDEGRLSGCFKKSSWNVIRLKK